MIHYLRCLRAHFVGDWFIKKKRESRTCCSSHFQRLWYCPSLLNEQTCRSLTQNMLCAPYPTLSRRIRTEYTYPLRHLLFATFLTEIEIYQISESQERASSKRFSYVCRPSRIAHDRASAMRSATAKLAKIFQIYNSVLRIGMLKNRRGLGALGGLGLEVVSSDAVGLALAVVGVEHSHGFGVGQAGVRFAEAAGFLFVEVG